MGQKVHPIGFRLGYIKTWNSRWYAQKGFADLLHEDLKIRKVVKAKLFHAGIAKIDIERTGKDAQARITIHTAKPGLIIGKKGLEIEKLKSELETQLKSKVSISIKEIKKPELEAQLIAESIAAQLEKRISYRRAMKKSVSSALRFGALGVKIRCAGRLGGAEIARTEWYREGRVPLHTLRADIDFGFAEAATTFGKIGVKVWVYKGDVLPGQEELSPKVKEKRGRN
ncbi:30S ribosomal protein S3 [Leptospirillum ferrooxidans]|uniref:Small ribosomal subunit protein uS3 n=3 Tax=root TaxID=1 RepID=I0IMU4_LEPFC|nr:30S ribosomal protein S3 [Leptospirillum ferrooxidans]BAM06593.1 ribosomal protein S3 [Leptospirillum ferrooxidans C2-3]